MTTTAARRDCARVAVLRAATCFIDGRTGACAGSGLGARARRSQTRLPTPGRVALTWVAPPGHRRAGEAQEGIALLEVAVPSTPNQ